MHREPFKPEPQVKKLWRLVNFIIMFFIILTGLLIMLAAQAFWAPAIILIGLIVIDAFVLWYIPAYYKSLEYRIEPDGVKANRGVFWRKKTTVPYRKITNVDITQGPVERLYGLSTLHVQTAGVSGPEGSKAELVFYGIRDCEDMKDSILRHLEEPMPKAAPLPSKPSNESDVLQAILKELTQIRIKLESKA
jgi:uncharacterized protein